MYSKSEVSELKKEFWTVFGQYMRPISSSEGDKINWINYKTGIKHIFFKADADNKNARIAIEISHPDKSIRELFFQQFIELKNLLHGALSEEWMWREEAVDKNGKTIATIYSELKGANIFKKEDWPMLISFFKQRLIALDEFWSSAKYSFEALQ